MADKMTTGRMTEILKEVKIGQVLRYQHRIIGGKLETIEARVMSKKLEDDFENPKLIVFEGEISPSLLKEGDKWTTSNHADVIRVMIVE